MWAERLSWMGRGNASAPDTVSGDVLGSATSPQGLNCAGNPPGICLGNDSEIAGQCITGGGAVSSPGDCAVGTDTSGTNPELTVIYAQAGADATTLFHELGQPSRNAIAACDHIGITRCNDNSGRRRSQRHSPPLDHYRHEGDDHD